MTKSPKRRVFRFFRESVLSLCRGIKRCDVKTSFGKAFLGRTEPHLDESYRRDGSEIGLVHRPPRALARRPSREWQMAAWEASMLSQQAEPLAQVAKLLVAVAPERRARRRHRGCACSLRERRDGDQRDQRDSGDEFFHDTSPCSLLQLPHGGGPLRCSRNARLVANLFSSRCPRMQGSTATQGPRLHSRGPGW
jgi:hypothetical protein